MNQYDTHFNLYDFLYLGLPGEKEFYVQESLNYSSPILEIGCGTGRITIPIAQAGADIVGIDNSEGLLSVANDKINKIKNIPGSIELINADMRNFSLNKKFNLIIIPYRAFLHMLDTESQKSCLKCIYDHLNDGGHLIMNMFFPRIDVMDNYMNQMGNAIKQVKSLELNDKRYMVFDSREYSSYDQLIKQNFIVEELDKDGVVKSKQYFPLTLRWVNRFEMEHLLEISGFKVLNLYGWFDKRPFDNFSEEMIWVVQKN